MRVTVDTWIAAPPDVCFDAARDLDLHIKSMSHTGERAVAGRTSGLIGPGEEVTWRARHLGITQHFASKITAFNPPTHFQDTMQRGLFASFVHDHYFTERDGGTAMRDVLEFSAPLGLLGRVAERMILGRYLENLLSARAETIKEAAEAAQNRSRTTGAVHATMEVRSHT